jgi:hypothetical protein
MFTEGIGALGGVINDCLVHSASIMRQILRVIVDVELRISFYESLRGLS